MLVILFSSLFSIDRSWTLVGKYPTSKNKVMNNDYER